MVEQNENKMKNKMNKTIRVADVLEFANAQLARKDDEATRDFKKGICAMIQGILHQSDNYEGFLFLGFEDAEYNTLGYWSRRYLANKNTAKRSVTAKP